MNIAIIIGIIALFVQVVFALEGFKNKLDPTWLAGLGWAVAFIYNLEIVISKIDKLQ